MASVKTIKVQKNGVIKEIEAHQEKAYAALGWIVINEPIIPNYANPFIKK